jgi:hypothetical protein
MAKLFIALFALAAVVAWAWSRHRRKRDEELTVPIPQQTSPPETIEEKPVELSNEVVVPETNEELGERPRPISAQESASDIATITFTELKPGSSDSDDPTSKPPAEVPAATTSPPDTRLSGKRL